MIIPVRCFTCNKVIADKWEEYKKLVEENNKDDPNKKFTLEDITINDKENPMKYFDNNNQKQALEKLGITKMCCVRHFISHVDLIEYI
tara:strand:- start:820 stop:1083 length:264 start_codon:yes stop_codon:yes gene_type:complete